MSISLNNYQAMISSFSGSKLGLDVYTRNLSSAMVTAKLFSTIQKTTSTENRSLLSVAQNNLKAINEQSKTIKQQDKYQSFMTASPDIAVVSSKPKTNTMTVDIKQLAAPQTNQSKFVSASGPSPFSASGLKFTLKTSEKTQSFDLAFEGTQTNKAVYQKIADVLNTSGSVKASLIQKDDQVSLKISHLQTGQNSFFSFTGEDADALGLNTVTETASNGSALINGEIKVQSSNTYTDKELGVVFEAKAITKTPVTLTSTLDAKALATDFKKLTDSLNQLTATYEAHSQYSATSKISAGFNLLKPQLDALGVRLGSNGLKVDVENLKAELEQDPEASRILSQFASISANAIKSSNPATLLTTELKKTYDNSDNTPYYLSNFGNIIDNNPYKGSLLDMLV